MFGINRYRSVEELADMAMRDLLDSKNPMKDESGMRKRGEVGDEGVKSQKGEEAMVALDNIFIVKNILLVTMFFFYQFNSFRIFITEKDAVR